MYRAPGTPPQVRDELAGEPHRRALDAMANAARRARPPDGRPVVDLGDEETGTRRLVARSRTSGAPRQGAGGSGLGPPVAPLSGWKGRGRAPVTRATSRPGWAAWRARFGLDTSRPRALLGVVAVGVLLVGGAGLALGLALRSPAGPATSRTGASSRAPSGGGPQSGKGGTKTGPGGSSTNGTKGAPASTTSTAPPPPTTAAPTPAGGPRLSSVSPSSGGPGQTVVVSGTGLVSSNGEVVAYFGGSGALTDCSTQTSCTVTVPELGTGPSPVRLTIVTANGRSNALSFSYL